MFVGPVQGLIALRRGIEAHADREHVRIGYAFQRREVEFQTFYLTLLKLQPPRTIARDRRLNENFRGILHLRAAPTSWPSLKMDGLIPSPLAHEQSLCEVFSIRDLPPRE